MIDIKPQWFLFLCFSLATGISAGCPHGKYGKGCLSVCLCSWEGTEICSSDNGTCICKGGYTGRLCDHDINECDSMQPPCYHAHMFCSNTRGSYKCVCRNGYLMSGLGHCTPCPPYLHGKNCSEMCSCLTANTVYCEGGYCVCEPGWGGKNCDMSYNDCAGVICPRSTVCIDGHRRYKCTCSPGFRLISRRCLAYETIAAAVEPSPGIGELVDVFILYRLPKMYKYKAKSLPDFAYKVTIEANGQRLCDISFKHTWSYMSRRSARSLSKLKNINPRHYNFYSHVKIVFTEAIFSVVHLVPHSDEYYEMVLEFDVRHKSQTEIDCLSGMRIPGTSQSPKYAVTYKRQSYVSFEVEFNETSNCGETPRVKWTFYSISKRIRYHPIYICLNVKYVEELDINALIEKADEVIISDHHSLKEIIPKSTLPVGINLVCVQAFVHRNRQLRVSTCGYILVNPSYIIQGKIVPDNEDLQWTYKYNLTVTADFVEPDAHSELEYHWTCIEYGYNSDNTPVDCKHKNEILRVLDCTQSTLVLETGFMENSRILAFKVTVSIKSRPSVKITDQVTVWGEKFSHIHHLPFFVECELTCGDVIGTGKNVVLKARFPFRPRVLVQIDYSWGMHINRVVMSDKEAQKIIPVLRTTVKSSWDGIRVSINANALDAGSYYAICLTTFVTVNRYVGRQREKFVYTTEAWYHFAVEKPPEGAGCTISPTTGEAVFTRFTVDCKNYVDPVSRLPLIYRLYQRDNEINTLIGFSGSNVMDTITLSSGGTSGVSTVNLHVEVKNVKGTTITVPLSVQLTTLDQAQALRRLIGNIQIQSGGQEDARTMKDIATVISCDSTADFGDKVTVRQDVLSNVQKLDSNSKDNIEQVSHVLSVSVEKHEEIEPSGLDCGLNTAARLAKYIGKVGNDNLDLTKNVAQSQVNALSKLLYVASSTGEFLSTQNLTNTTNGMEMLNENIQQSLLATQSINKIADALLASLAGNKETVKMVTEFMNLYVASNKVDSESAFEVDSDDAKFSLPSLDSGVPENEIIDGEFEIFHINPFGWTASKVHGKSPVVKVNLARQSKKHLLQSGEKETFRFSKPADVFLNYNASGKGEENPYHILVKVVKNPYGLNVIRMSSCVHLIVKVSTERTTVMRITGPDKLKILVKAMYTNTFSYFDSIYDEEMIQLPIIVPVSIKTSMGELDRERDLLFLPQLSLKQIKRNRPYYRIMIRLKVNQEVDTRTLQLAEIEGNNTEFVDEEPGEYYNVTIQATPHEMSCLHFDEQKADYLSDECRVSMYSNLDVMHCRCLVAAAFTGSVLVAPRLINPLDIGLFLQVFRNPLVVSMVIAVWLIYIALIACGRILDQQDEIKAAVTVLDDNRDEHNYVYLICVVTGWSQSSATSSNVFICLKGSWSQSENHVLQDPTRHLFRSGAENWFMLTTEDDIGELKSVVIWTDFSGAYPSWFLSSVFVQNMQTGESWICIYNNWISVNLGTEQLQAEIPAIQEKAYSSKWTLQIAKKGQNDIRNNHLWFGIIMKTPYNKFTRVRRLTTGLSILQSSMLLNHMFFGIRDKDDPGQFVEILGQTIHVTSLIIAIQTSFVMLCLGIGISTLFNSVAPHPTILSTSSAKSVRDIIQRTQIKAAALAHFDSDSEDSDSSEDDETESSESSTSSEEMNSNTSNRSFNVNNSTGRRESSVDKQQTLEKPIERKDTIPTQERLSVSDNTLVSDGKPPEPQGNTAFMMPWWFIYITWTVLAVYNLFLAYYIMLYGLSLGYEKSVDWALAFFTSFIFDVLIIQPAKVILLVFMLVLIFQQRHTFMEQAPVAKLKDGIRLVQERKKYNRKFKTLLPKVTCRVPLNTSEARAVLERLAVETAARQMLRDLFLYSIFMVSVLLVAYGHMDVRSQFLQTQYVKHKFLKTPIFEPIEGEGYASLGELQKVRSAEDMWQYIRTVVAPAMMKHKDTISADHDIYLMGTARLRQVRSQDDSDACEDLPNVLESLFVEETCSYSSSLYISEETNTYDGTWRVLSNISKDIIDDSPYVYRSSKELNGALFIARMMDGLDVTPVLLDNNSTLLFHELTHFPEADIFLDSTHSRHHGIYSGGGYVIPFGQDDLGAIEDALTKLYNLDWIDQLTKCVFVEFTLYNAASDHFTHVIIAFEFANFGVIYPYAFINSANLLNQELNKQLWLQLSEGFMVICSLFYTFVEIQSFRKLRFRKYFGNLWCCLEVFTIIITCVVGIIFFLRYYEFVEILKDFQKYGLLRFLNFEAVFQMHELLHIFLALLGGIVIFKMLKVTAFNPLVVITTRSFVNVQADMYGLLIITVILFLAFAATGILIFGKSLRSYRSIPVSLFTLLFFIMGESEYTSLVAADLYLGRIYFLMVTFASQYVIVNFFCSILQEGFELTRYMAFRREREIIKYMMNRIQFYSGFGPKNVKSKKS